MNTKPTVEIIGRIPGEPADRAIRATDTTRLLMTCAFGPDQINPPITISLNGEACTYDPNTPEGRALLKLHSVAWSNDSDPELRAMAALLRTAVLHCTAAYFEVKETADVLGMPSRRWVLPFALLETDAVRVELDARRETLDRLYARTLAELRDLSAEAIADIDQGRYSARRADKTVAACYFLRSIDRAAFPHTAGTPRANADIARIAASVTEAMPAAAVH